MVLLACTFGPPTFNNCHCSVQHVTFVTLLNITLMFVPLQFTAFVVAPLGRYENRGDFGD